MNDRVRKRIDDLVVGSVYEVSYSDGTDQLCYFAGEYRGLHKQDGRWFLTLASRKVTQIIPTRYLEAIKCLT